MKISMPMGRYETEYMYEPEWLYHGLSYVMDGKQYDYYTKYEEGEYYDELYMDGAFAGKGYFVINERDLVFEKIRNGELKDYQMSDNMKRKFGYWSEARAKCEKEHPDEDESEA